MGQHLIGGESDESKIELHTNKRDFVRSKGKINPHPL